MRLLRIVVAGSILWALPAYGAELRIGLAADVTSMDPHFLNIAPNMLTRRLGVLVDAGLLEKRQYCEKPPRYEYIVTPRGRDFRSVLWSLQSWGNRHFAPEGESVMLIDKETGERADPILVDRRTGKPITEATHSNAPGPAASARVQRRLSKPRPQKDGTL